MSNNKKFSYKEYIEEHPDLDYKEGTDAIAGLSYCYYKLGHNYDQDKDGDLLNRSFLCESYFFDKDPLFRRTCESLYKSRRNKKYRLQPCLLLVERQSMYRGKVHGLFLTLTFNDQYLNSTTPQERRSAIRSYLNSITPYYVANIDFGSRRGREHYHAVISANYIDTSVYRSMFFGSNIRVSHLFGSSLGSPSKSYGDNYLPNYLIKLTYHAIKETTKSKRILLSPGLTYASAEEQLKGIDISA